MRSFPFRLQARLLKIDVIAIDGGWELWVAEDEQQLACGGRITVDQAMAGWRVGEDRVLELARGSEEQRADRQAGGEPAIGQRRGRRGGGIALAMMGRLQRDQIVGVMLVLAVFLLGQYLLGDRPVILLSTQADQVTAH